MLIKKYCTVYKTRKTDQPEALPPIHQANWKCQKWTSRWRSRNLVHTSKVERINHM